MGQVFLRVLRFLLSDAFHQRSTLIVTLKLLLPELRMGDAWESSKSNVLTNQELLDRKVL